MNLSKFILFITASFLIFFTISCDESDQQTNRQIQKIDVIYDTDANNEVDDQHALAYLLFNGDYFNVEGVTVNATSTPDGFNTVSDVQDHYDEARRVMQLCGDLYGKIPLLTGAQDSFEEIRIHLDQDVEFEFVTVRYGDPSGTDAVKVTQAQILHRMPGLGPVISEPVIGRHGGEFNNWGDYSANLFEMYSMYGNP